MKYINTLCVLMVFACCLSGCASTTLDDSQAMISTEAPKMSMFYPDLGTLAIIGLPDSTESEVKGVLAGKAEGAVVGTLYFCALVPIPPLCLPLGVMTGALAPSRDEFEQWKNAICETVLKADLRREMIDEIQLHAGQFHLQSIADSDKYVGLIQSKDIETENGRKTVQDYTNLASSNIDSVLEVGPSRVTLERGDKEGLHLILETQALLVSTWTGKTLQRGEFHLSGSLHVPLERWGEWNAKLVRDQLDLILSYAGGYIAEQMLALDAPLLLSSSFGNGLVLRWQPTNTKQLRVDPESLSYEVVVVNKRQMTEATCGILCLPRSKETYVYWSTGTRGNSESVGLKEEDCDPYEDSRTYYWSARAVFTYDGAIKKSKWANPKRIKCDSRDDWGGFQ